MLELIAPHIGGVTASDGSHHAADEKVNGGPSVLYDAVAVLPGREGAQTLAREATAKDFVNDAFAHLKFIAWCESARPLLDAAGVGSDMDDGFMQITQAADANRFVEACRELRLWDREPRVSQV